MYKSIMSYKGMLTQENLEFWLLESASESFWQ